MYNRNLISEIDNEMIQLTISEQTFLDIRLMEIRGKSISYSTFRKKKMLEKEKSLEQEIFHLEQNLSELVLPDLVSKQNELESIRKQKLKGQCIRSKVNWIEEGEKPFKYFTSLESRNFVNKQIQKLMLDDGTLIGL